MHYIATSLKQRSQDIQNSTAWVRDSRLGAYIPGYYRHQYLVEALITVATSANATEDCTDLMLRFSGPDMRADGYLEWTMVGEHDGKVFRRQEEALFRVVPGQMTAHLIKGTFVSDYDAFWLSPEYRALAAIPSKITLEDNAYFRLTEL